MGLGWGVSFILRLLPQRRRAPARAETHLARRPAGAEAHAAGVGDLLRGLANELLLLPGHGVSPGGGLLVRAADGARNSHWRKTPGPSSNGHAPERMKGLPGDARVGEREGRIAELSAFAGAPDSAYDH